MLIKNLFTLFLAVSILIFSGMKLQAVVIEQSVEDRVIVDFTAAEKTVEWLLYVKTNPGYDNIKRRFMETVATTAGVQSIIHHWSRFKTWNNDEYFKFIALALDMLPENESLSFELPGYFDENKQYWQEALSNPQKIASDIQKMKNLQLEKTARLKARENLPSDVRLDVDFYFVLFGASTAFAVGKENGMDVLQLPRDNKGELNLDAISRTIAHEMHHNGFSIANKLNMPEDIERQHITLLGVMAAEGSASYFNQTPFRRFLTKAELNKGIDKEVLVWQKKIPTLPKLFKKAKADLEQSVLGKYDRRKIYSEWLSGYTGDAYIVGTAMIKLITEELGHNKTMNVIRDYRSFLHLYNMAALQANAKGGRHFVFPEELAVKMLNFKKPVSG